MDNYLTDREFLERSVDAFLKQKPLSGSEEEKQALREKLIESLDRKIGYAIFGQLSDEQKATCEKMADDETTTEQAFLDFFAQAGVDLEKTMLETTKKFAEKYLGGGQNGESE